MKSLPPTTNLPSSGVPAGRLWRTAVAAVREDRRPACCAKGMPMMKLLYLSGGQLGRGVRVRSAWAAARPGRASRPGAGETCMSGPSTAAGGRVFFGVRWKAKRNTALARYGHLPRGSLVLESRNLQLFLVVFPAGSRIPDQKRRCASLVAAVQSSPSPKPITLIFQ